MAAWLREGAYRVGQGDSFNRMLVHIVPLIVLLAVCWWPAKPAEVGEALGARR